MILNVPGLNFQQGLDVFDGEIDDYVSALKSFIISVPGIITKLRDVTAENLHEYVINIHGLKSTGGWICAENIQKEALKLETFAKAGNLSEINLRNDKFLNDVNIFLNNLEAELQKNLEE
jgi:hypothetical protein